MTLRGSAGIGIVMVAGLFGCSDRGDTSDPASGAGASGSEGDGGGSGHSTGKGGTQATEGSSTTGGSSTIGGSNTGAGSSATGGSSTTGGSDAGAGSSATGGSSTTGGSDAGAGSSATGGMLEAGGAHETAGADPETATGGFSSAGAPSSTGGASAGGATGTASVGGAGGATGSAGGASAGGTTGIAGAGGAEGGSGSSDFAVIGYLPSWAGSVSDVAFERLTHVNYAFALPTATGEFEPVEDEAKLAELVTAAHSSGVKVLISIGGWNDGDDSAFHTLAATEATRATFADTVHAYVSRHSLDGADIDWEYPEEENSADYADLITELSERLHPEGKLVTAAVSASSWGSGGITDAVYQLFDYLNIMAYDGGEDVEHSPYTYAEAALSYWLETKLAPREKLVLGVPFYARPTWNSYASIVAQDPTAADRDYHDGQYYNGIPTIQDKTRLALDRAAGIMMWELSQDTHDETSLLMAIDEVVHP